MDLGNTFTQPISYIIIWVQIDGVQGYDEDQIVLVVPDVSNFAAQAPMILRMSTIGPSHECDKREGDRHIGDTLAQCTYGLPFGSLTSDCHLGR